MPEGVQADPEAALRLYALDAPVVIGRIEAGFINDNWLVADGTSQGRYVLRAYRRVTDVRRIAFQLEFQAQLLAKGFPTAPSIGTRSGEPFASVEGLHWALFEFVAGEAFDFSSEAQAREAGRRLAQFEAIAAGYEGPVVQPPAGEAGYRNWLAPVSSHVWRTSVLAEENEERLHELFPGDEFKQDLAFFGRWRRDAAQVWPADRLARLPEAWLHGDYHGRNMVFSGDVLTGLFDFDFVTSGPRTFDVGRGLFNFGRERRGSTMLREEFCRAFLEGFESEVELSHEERQALPVMAVMNWVPDASFYAARQLDAVDADIGERLHRDVQLMRAIQGEMRRLAPRFGWQAA